jgi:hypothetical protein
MMGPETHMGCPIADRQPCPAARIVAPYQVWLASGQPADLRALFVTTGRQRGISALQLCQLQHWCYEVPTMSASGSASLAELERAMQLIELQDRAKTD